tara:strand:+ start:1094 stop:1753 length:660 start_codon:yes stop_codon:yes gene_type:complete
MTKQARTFLIQQPHLVLSRARLGELETDTTTRQLSVDLRVGIESVINTSLLLLIEDDLQDLAAIFLGAETLADDLDGVDEVGEDGVVNGGECSGTGSLLSLRGTGAVGALWAGENATRGKEEDVAVGELLLELTGETMKFCQHSFIESSGRGEISYRCCTRWKPWRDGTGTKMTIAFLPWPTSTCKRIKSQHAISMFVVETMVRSPSDSEIPQQLGRQK